MELKREIIEENTDELIIIVTEWIDELLSRIWVEYIYSNNIWGMKIFLEQGKNICIPNIRSQRTLKYQINHNKNSCLLQYIDILYNKLQQFQNQIFLNRGI